MRRHAARGCCKAAALAALLAMQAGCSWQQAYHGFQYSQRSQCQKIDDREERRRCQSDASLPYDRYTAEAARSRQP